MKILIKTRTVKYLFFLCFNALMLCFLSCKVKVEQYSLANNFEIIDSLIEQNQFKDAQKELKKVEKRAYDYWTYIGIYKRFSLLGDKQNSELILKKALKKNAKNLELSAIYTKFLLEQDRINEAVSIAAVLKNSRYGSFYSEAILKQAQTQSIDDNKFVFYENENFYPIYYDAYKSNKNPVWIKNCAIHNLRKGLYENAAALTPTSFSNADDAYFWAMVLYDAHKYYECINVIDISQNYFEQSVKKNALKTSVIKQVALASDAYMALSDMENAEKYREQIVYNMDNLYIANSDKELLPVILVNSAIWAKNQDLLEQCSDILFYLVRNYPTYYPGLILYADFAYESNLEQQEDAEIKALRNAGIFSTAMEQYDNRRKIPLSDALYRIDAALRIEPNPYLEIAKLDLRYKTQKELSQKDKLRDLWLMLEDNYKENEKYETLLVLYSLNFLLGNQYDQDAWNLFYKYVLNKISIDKKQDFWEVFQEKMKMLDVAMVEFGGYFAASQKLTSVSRRILEYCVYESGGILGDKLLSPLVDTESCMNLADIYYSCGESRLALDLYGAAAGRETRNNKRSEIFYRIACIYMTLGDEKAAQRSCEYALTIFPDNIKATVLLSKIHIK